MWLTGFFGWFWDGLWSGRASCALGEWLASVTQMAADRTPERSLIGVVMRFDHSAGGEFR